MDKRTETAIRKSIEHWKDNENITGLSDADISAASCALCSEFLDRDNLYSTSECGDCPIAQRTGRDLCRGTPYSMASKALDNRDFIGFKKAATQEREFLESLLPGEVELMEGDIVRVIDGPSYGAAYHKGTLLTFVKYSVDDKGDITCNGISKRAQDNGYIVRQIIRRRDVEFVVRPIKGEG